MEASEDVQRINIAWCSGLKGSQVQRPCSRGRLHIGKFEVGIWSLSFSSAVYFAFLCSPLNFI